MRKQRACDESHIIYSASTVFGHWKSNFIEKSKNLNTDLEIILLNHQNNFAGILNVMSNTAKCFDFLAINFIVLSNYFDDPVKLFFSSGLYLAWIFRFFSKISIWTFWIIHFWIKKKSPTYNSLLILRQMLNNTIVLLAFATIFKNSKSIYSLVITSGEICIISSF